MPTLIEKLHKSPRKTRLTDKTYVEAKREFERMYLQNMLERTGGNISAASRLAKLDRKQLRQKAQKLGILINAARIPQSINTKGIEGLVAIHS